MKYGTFEKEAPAGNAKTDEPETVKQGYLRGYTFFDSSQIDGVEFPEIQHPDYQARHAKR